MLLSAAVSIGFLTLSVNQTPAVKRAFPKTPPPEFVFLAAVDKDRGTIKLQSARHVLVPEFIDRVVERNGKKVTERVLAHVSKVEVREQELPLKSIRVLDAEGKEVRGEDLWRRLTPGKMVLRQPSTEPVDPAYRDVLSRDALIIAPRDGGA